MQSHFDSTALCTFTTLDPSRPITRREYMYFAFRASSRAHHNILHVFRLPTFLRLSLTSNHKYLASTTFALLSTSEQLKYSDSSPAPLRTLRTEVFAQQQGKTHEEEETCASQPY